MKVKEETKDRFISAVANLVRAIKNEAAQCGEICGGLNEKEVIIIGFVGENQNVKMSDIAASIDAPMSTLTTIVDKLVDKRYLSRDHSGADRRVINVYLDTNGKTAYKKLFTKKKLIAEKVLSQFSEKDQANFISNITILSSLLGSGKD